MVESVMDGKKYMASRLATTWRRTLMRGQLDPTHTFGPRGMAMADIGRDMTEHIGLLPPQPAWNPETQPTSSMRAAPEPHNYDFGSKEDLAVQDVLSDDFERLWIETGRGNRAAFEKVFRPVPNDTIRSWKGYGEYLKPNAGISVSTKILIPSSCGPPLRRGH